MIRLEAPKMDNSKVIDDCANSISGNLGHKLETAKSKLLDAYKNYDSQALRQQLFKLEMCEQIIISSLSGDEFNSLYTQHFVPKQKPCRKYYQYIRDLTNACPYCGGLSDIDSLDHYLAKSKYPVFSIYSGNLIPACKKCNEDAKGSSVAKINSEQILHPYFDKSCFFEQQWVFAKYDKTSVESRIRYYLQFNASWDKTDKARAENHFAKFNLLERFSLKADSELSEIEEQMEGLLIETTPEVVIERFLTIPTKQKCVNHWKRVMFLSLIDYVKKTFILT